MRAAYTFNPSTWRQKQASLRGFKANLVYLVEFQNRQPGLHRESCVKKQTKQTEKNKTSIFNLLWLPLLLLLR